MPSSLLTTALLALLGTSHLTTAHMDLMYPPPLKSKFNPFAKASGNIDSDMTSPLLASGSNYPCKGYQTMLGTPEGASVATFSPGGKYNLTIDGNAFHEGGSCQASLSYDKGKSFTVIQSWVGECPTATGGSFDFTVPADAPAGTDVLFAWTWFNEVGNREMYMNCASVTIGGGSSKRKRDATAFSARPALFTANIGNGCGTDAGTDVIFPNPGPDVVSKGSKMAKPTGTCQAAADAGSDSGSGSGSSAAATATASASAGSGSGSGAASSSSTTAQAAAPTVTSPGAGSGSGSSSSGSSSSVPGGVFVTVGNSASASATASGFATSATASVSVSAPTTLATSVLPAASSDSGSGSGGSATTSAAAPAGTGTGTGSGSSGAGGTLMSGPCTNEGAWNCIGGTSFQRCASGSWSVQMALAAGTSCTPGVSDSLWRRRGGWAGRVRRGL